MTVQLSLVAFQLRWQHAILSKLNNKPNPSKARMGVKVGGILRPSLAYVTTNGLILICCSISGIHIVLPMCISPPNPIRIQLCVAQSVKNLTRFSVLRSRTYRDTIQHVSTRLIWLASQLANWSTIWPKIGLQTNFYRFQSATGGITNVSKWAETSTTNRGYVIGSF